MGKYLEKLDQFFGLCEAEATRGSRFSLSTAERQTLKDFAFWLDTQDAIDRTKDDKNMDPK